MPFIVYARDGAGMLILRRDTQEAAEKKAAELNEMGCFEIEIVQKADQIGCLMADSLETRT